MHHDEDLFRNRMPTNCPNQKQSANGAAIKKKR